MNDIEVRVQKLETEISRLTNLIEELQEQFILLPDIARYGTLQKFLKK